MLYNLTAYEGDWELAVQQLMDDDTLPNFKVCSMTAAPESVG